MFDVPTAHCEQNQASAPPARVQPSSNRVMLALLTCIYYIISSVMFWLNNAKGYDFSSNYLIKL